MIQEFVEAWDANKDRLKEYIGEHLETGLGSYQSLVKALFEQVINPYLKDNGNSVYNLECIHEINDSKYQGCLLYVIPLDNYEPSSYDYVLTFAEYGSCPVCDTLEGIWEYYRIANKPDETVRDLMNLCLHLLQHCKIPYSYNETLDNE